MSDKYYERWLETYNKLDLCEAIRKSKDKEISSLKALARNGIDLANLLLEADAEVARLEKRLSLLRNSLPTQWAYDQVCKARTKWQERAEKAERKLRLTIDVLKLLEVDGSLAARNVLGDIGEHPPKRPALVEENLERTPWLDQANENLSPLSDYQCDCAACRQGREQHDKLAKGGIITLPEGEGTPEDWARLLKDEERMHQPDPREKPEKPDYEKIADELESAMFDWRSDEGLDI